MKISRTRIALLALLCGTPLLHADILMLKNGTKVEGTILGQNEQGVKMRYRLTPKIMDEKVFPSAEIEKVIKQTPQEVEVVELRKLMPTADLMKADTYEQVIQDRLRPFVNKYPGTAEAKEVDEIITKMQEEKSMVANGQLKLDGKWLSVKETKAEQFNIEAYGIVTGMREKAAKLDYTGALREFDRLLMPAPAYKGSSYFVQAVPEAIGVLDKWITVLEKMASEQLLLEKARKDGLAKLQEPDLSKTKEAIAEEIKKWKQAYEVERRQRLRWITPYKYDQPSIQTALKEAKAEHDRLQLYDLDTIKMQNELFTACYRKIGEEDYLGGAAAYQRIQPTMIMKDFADVPKDLYGRLIALHRKLSLAATTTSQTSGSAAIGGTPATTQDPRVAEILRQRQAAADAAAQPAAQPAPATPATGTPPPAAAPAVPQR